MTKKEIEEIKQKANDAAYEKQKLENKLVVLENRLGEYYRVIEDLVTTVRNLAEKIND